MLTRRIIIVGGPLCGKSTMAAQLRAQGIPTYCGDPQTRVRQVELDVTYLPLMPWSDASAYVAERWLTMDGPWCCEGVVMARAVRKLIKAGLGDVLKGVEIMYLDHPYQTLTPGQASMAKAVATVWSEVEQNL